MATAFQRLTKPQQDDTSQERLFADDVDAKKNSRSKGSADRRKTAETNPNPAQQSIPRNIPPTKPAEPLFSREGWEGVPVEPFEPIGPDPLDPFEHPQAGPCPNCGCCFWWENPYGGWMCCGCYPRPNPKMIRRTVTVLVEDKFTLFEPVPMKRWRSDVDQHERAKRDAREELLCGPETF